MKTSASQNMKRFNYLIGATGAAYHAVALKLGLSDSVMQVLYTVYDSGAGCLLTDLCRLTGLSKQTVNSALRRLEQDGAVYLAPANARSKQVELTACGVLLAERTVARLIRAENDILDSWSAEEVRQYLSLTERYLAALQEKTASL